MSKPSVAQVQPPATKKIKIRTLNEDGAFENILIEVPWADERLEFDPKTMSLHGRSPEVKEGKGPPELS